MNKFNKNEMRAGKAILFWLFSVGQLVAGFICFILTIISSATIKNFFPLWTLVFWLPWIGLNITDMFVVRSNDSRGTICMLGILSVLFGLIGGIWMVILSDYVIMENEGRPKETIKVR